MEISFYLDDIFYHGTAVPYEKPDTVDTHFVVRLENLAVFHVHMSNTGEWISDDTKSTELISVVGSEIQRRDDVEPSTPIVPGQYYSNANSGGQKPVIENGEIINEPDDVDEQSINA